MKNMFSTVIISDEIILISLIWIIFDKIKYNKYL